MIPKVDRCRLFPWKYSYLSAKVRFFVAASVIFALPHLALAAQPHCDDHEPYRQAFFGDLHVHTALSSDAYGFGVRLGPDDAYRFAFGEEILLPPNDSAGRGTRRTRIDRPLDFAAVTDHAEFLGEGVICHSADHPNRNADFCDIFRAPGGRAPELIFRISSPVVWRDSETCGDDDEDCIRATKTAWRETVAASNAWNDTGRTCARTTFPGYEWSSHRLGSNLHRNVIFRNDKVPERPLSYLEVGREWDLWEALRRECLDAGTGCDVIAIPHNSNISNGRMFAVDYPGADTVADERKRAELRIRIERLYEIMQHKGDSECRNGISSVLGATDEFCDFEKFEDLPLARWYDEEPGECHDGWFADWWLHLGPDCVSRLNYGRYALAAGLSEEKRLGVNPFQFGLMASTDTHNAMAGGVNERDFPGHLGMGDAAASQRSSLDPAIPGNAGNNPGGLIGVWAEENTRDSLFEAMRRREVFGTSGPRLKPRFFASWSFPPGLCSDPALLAKAYASGVPMGGELPSHPKSAAGPEFLVTAMRDAGTTDAPGGLLQRIQIIKVWVDGTGNTRQEIVDVAGGPNDAVVDPETCTPRGNGHDSLCAIWQDPNFDPTIGAAYYARVLENPSCRYSTWDCLTLNGKQRPKACDDGSVPKWIQERAWTSPVWFTPST